ncbi:MAG TPA: hypothetical protein VNG31_04545, partial [Candidatus Baltobacteraceae bacterium]|nr:hypothetical protein [Candidatus Baltobacteraceae bacterium]
SVAGLYYYLPSKQLALYLVCNRIFDRLEAGTTTLASIEDPVVRLETFVREHLRFMIGNPDAYRVLLHDMDVLELQHGRDLHARRRRYFAVAAQLIHALAQRSGLTPPRLATAALFGMLNWAPMWYRRDLDGDVDGLASKVLTIFLHGVAPATPVVAEVAS